MLIQFSWETVIYLLNSDIWRRKVIMEKIVLGNQVKHLISEWISCPHSKAWTLQPLWPLFTLLRLIYPSFPEAKWLPFLPPRRPCIPHFLLSFLALSFPPFRVWIPSLCAVNTLVAGCRNLSLCLIFSPTTTTHVSRPLSQTRHLFFLSLLRRSVAVLIVLRSQLPSISPPSFCHFSGSYRLLYCVLSVKEKTH